MTATVRNSELTLRYKLINLDKQIMVDSSYLHETVKMSSSHMPGI